MAVNEIKLSAEQKAEQAKDQSNRESDFAKKLVETYDLSSSITSAIDNAVDNPPPPTEEPVEDEAVEEADDTADETAEASEESVEETTDDTEDEDLIPKSKVQKRMDELTREKRRLEAEIAKMRRDNESKQITKDPEIEKLEAMDAAELRSLKKQVRLAQIKSSADEAKLTELMELEDKIDATISSAPSRFQKNQVSKFYEAVDMTRAELPEFEKVSNDIFKYAQTIFNGSPELKSSVSGQERAWLLAVDHYKALSKFTGDKSKVNDLERKVNTLKKKVSLDTSSNKGDLKVNDLAKSYNKAKAGTSEDKMNFFRKRLNTDNLIPDEFKPQR